MVRDRRGGRFCGQPGALSMPAWLILAAGLLAGLAAAYLTGLPCRKCRQHRAWLRRFRRSAK